MGKSGEVMLNLIGLNTPKGLVGHEGFAVHQEGFNVPETAT